MSFTVSWTIDWCVLLSGHCCKSCRVSQNRPRVLSDGRPCVAWLLCYCSQRFTVKGPDYEALIPSLTQNCLTQSICADAIKPGSGWGCTNVDRGIFSPSASATGQIIDHSALLPLPRENGDQKALFSLSNRRDEQVEDRGEVTQNVNTVIALVHARTQPGSSYRPCSRT